MKSRGLIALATLPAVLVGALLWWMADLLPECSTTLLGRLDSPDASKSLIIFTRDCGAGGLNTQAAIMPAGGTLEGNAIGFLALEGRHSLDARWDAYGNLEMSVPPGATIARQMDEASGIAIIYR